MLFEKRTFAAADNPGRGWVGAEHRHEVQSDHDPVGVAMPSGPAPKAHRLPVRRRAPLEPDELAAAWEEIDKGVWEDDWETLCQVSTRLTKPRSRTKHYVESQAVKDLRAQARRCPPPQQAGGVEAGFSCSCRRPEELGETHA